MYDNDIISLDLWGGTHFLKKNNLNYEIQRDCGLFSNLTVCMYGIMKYYELGYKPSSISLYLKEYKNNYDFYPDLFKTSNSVLEFADISEPDMFNFFRYCEPNFLGLGRKINDVNLTILKRLLDKYFILSDSCNNIIENIINNNQINLNNTVFIWARKTDKVHEVDIPEAKTYIDILHQHNLINKEIILQTDDISVLKEFESLKLNFKTLNELPYSDTSDGFHSKMSSRYDDDQFYNKFNMTKIEYVKKLMCLAKIASMSQYTIIYPGCLATFIPILKNSFVNHFGFMNKISLLK